MKVKGINASSKKTKKLIKDTFAELVQEKKQINNISVTELVKKANITRATFYSHYDNINSVIEEFRYDTLKLINDEQGSFDKYMDNLIENIKINEKTYKMLLECDEAIYLSDYISKIIVKKLTIIFPSPDNKTTLNILLYTNGIINIFIKYLKNEINISLDEINVYSKEMFYSIFKI